MNRKRTNRLVAILNIIAVASIYILAFSTSYLLSSMMSGENSGKSVYDSFIIDTLLNNIQIIMVLVYGGVGILNIICAIQNKEDKKICFWQLAFGFCEVWSAINTSLARIVDESDVIEWIDKILFGIIPIVLVIINFIRIKKNRPKVIQIISYVGVIILAILNILDIIGAYWSIIAVLMQLIYIHFQDKYIEESKSRKIVNLILYYIIQVILVIFFLGMILVSLLITKVNDVKWKKSLSELYNNITTLQGAKTKELYIPVEKNYKYGFINEAGKEKISCEYDRVTYFNEIEIDNSTYYIAFAKKNDKFFIISKTNNSIEITGNLQKYLKSIDNHFTPQMLEMFNKDGDYRLAYLQSFEFFLQAFTRGEKKLTQQILEKSDNDNTITLNEKNSKYYYTNKNYSILIEPIYEDDNEMEADDQYYYDDYYDEDENTYYLASNNTKHKVTITKTNGEQETSIIYLTDFDEDDATLDTFTNGYIGFEDEENKRNGWIDENGNKITIPDTYIINDIKDNKVILQADSTEDYNSNEKPELYFIIIDMTGRTLLQTTALDVYDDMYLVKNNNKKMVLMDKDLNVISNEYDKIISTMQMDISPQYSSYY